MIRTIIVEDEQHCIKRITKLLTKYDHLVEVLGIVNSVSEAKKAFLTLKPDLVFMDIQLGDETSFDLLSELKNIDFDIIFTTAYNDFAVKAFRFSAIDYLMKPIAEDQLDEALHKVLGKSNDGDRQENFQALIHNLNSESEMSKKLSISSVKGTVFVPLSDIVRLQGESGYTDVYSMGGTKITATKSLKFFESILNSEYFFRCHKSHIVNRDYILEYKKSEGGSIIMSSGDEVGIAVLRKQDFLRWLGV